MNGLLYSVFISLALRMTVITALVLLIKTAFRSKLSAKMQCIIWLIPFIQCVFCIFGVKIPTAASIYNIAPGAVMTRTGAAAAETAVLSDPRNIIAFAWALGAVILAAWYLAVFAVYRSRARKFPPVTDAETLKSADEIRRALKIPPSERIDLCYGDTAQAMPHLIILPRGCESAETRQILIHELCHYRSRDFYKLRLGLAVVCANWFNPLIWLAYKVFRSDIEMMCDDRVLKLTDSKKLYAKTLVKCASMKNRFVPGSAPAHNGKSEVRLRVERIATLKKLKPAWMAAASFLCVTVSLLCLTDAVAVTVENTTDVAATPEPAAIISTPVPEMPAVAATVAPETETAATQNESYNSGYEPEVYAPSEPVEPAAETYEAYEPEAAAEEEASAAEDISSGKETYELDDGRTVILQYDGETVENGYIIN